jgi:hypothetical protein
MPMAVAHARVLGPKRKTTPSGEPIFISSWPFDDTRTTPAQAIAESAKRWHKIEPHLPHWEVVAVRDMTAWAIATQRPKYTRVYLMHYMAEKDMRAHLGIDESVIQLNEFRGDACWYPQDAT